MYPYGPEEGIESTGTGVASGCELPHMCVCWAPNLGPLAKEQVSLTTDP